MTQRVAWPSVCWLALVGVGGGRSQTGIAAGTIWAQWRPGALSAGGGRLWGPRRLALHVPWGLPCVERRGVSSVPRTLAVPDPPAPAISRRSILQGSLDQNNLGHFEMPETTPCPSKCTVILPYAQMSSLTNALYFSPSGLPRRLITSDGVIPGVTY